LPAEGPTGGRLSNKAEPVKAIRSSREGTAGALGRGLALRPKDTVMMTREARNTSAAVLSTENGHLTSGLMVFSSTRKALYINEAAQQLLRRLSGTENPIDQLLDEMLPLLHTDLIDRGWKQLDARRLTTTGDRAIVIRTFGIPDRLDMRRSLIVLTISETQAS
jgi:hypothetical protein